MFEISIKITPSGVSLDPKFRMCKIKFDKVPNPQKGTYSYYVFLNFNGNSILRNNIVLLYCLKPDTEYIIKKGNESFFTVCAKYSTMQKSKSTNSEM